MQKHFSKGKMIHLQISEGKTALLELIMTHLRQQAEINSSQQVSKKIVLQVNKEILQLQINIIKPWLKKRL